MNHSRRFFFQRIAAIASGLLLSSFHWITRLVTEDVVQYNVILGRPTKDSIALSVLTKTTVLFYVRYGQERNNLNQKTKPYSSDGIHPTEVTLTNLKPSSQYFYQIIIGNTTFSDTTIHTFFTQRSASSDFTFTISADSHLGTPRHCNVDLYARTIQNIKSQQPDFHISLGDDFRASKDKNPSAESIAALYVQQREFLGKLCHSVPFFFVQGNHEMETPGNSDGTENSLAAWSFKARTTFLPVPPAVNNNRHNYYSFSWGNSLFVVLDVYWYSAGSSNDDGRILDNEWDFSLGKEQYNWLKAKLEQSDATNKFVFGHHVLGSCRGGVEWADKYEWGGNGRSGLYEFDELRNGWGLPIHQLMVKNNVTAFFQGHDHIFVKNEKEGVSYITCPMPADAFSNPYNSEAYLTGDKIPNAGHLRVTVSQAEVLLEYIKSVLPESESATVKNGQSIYACSLLTKEVKHHIK